MYVKSKKEVIILVCSIVFLIGVFFISRIFNEKNSIAEKIPPAYNSALLLSGSTFKVTIAETSAELAQGLSGREPLAENEGMLFIFPVEGKYGFWMKNMLFPIDIIWFASDKTLIGASENVQPKSYPEILYPPSDARYVLELPAGTFSKSNLAIGDIFSFE